MTPLDAESVAAQLRAVRETVAVRVVGAEEPITLALAAILAGGHVLFEDVPGLGKTITARALAAAVGLQFTRLQCTPDLLPADVTGSFVYVPATTGFEFRPGPIFTGLLLADELNRTTPKTQSALLEAMAEGQVTVEGRRHALPSPFHVIATANPIEFEGTYSLPEAQLDRFMVRLRLGYPSADAEADIVRRRISRGSDELAVAEVLAPGQLAALQTYVESVHVDSDLIAYSVNLTRATRDDQHVSVGASPRASQALILLARAIAVQDGRTYVLPDDVKRVAVAVLAHRLTLTPQAWAQGVDAEDLVRRALGAVRVPPTVAVG